MDVSASPATKAKACHTCGSTVGPPCLTTNGTWLCLNHYVTTLIRSATVAPAKRKMASVMSGEADNVTDTASGAKRVKLSTPSTPPTPPPATVRPMPRHVHAAPDTPVPKRHRTTTRLGIKPIEAIVKQRRNKTTGQWSGLVEYDSGERSWVPLHLIDPQEIHKLMKVTRDGGASFIGRRVQRFDDGVWVTGKIEDYNPDTVCYTVFYDDDPSVAENEFWSSEHRLLHMDDTVDHLSTLLTHVALPDGKANPLASKHALFTKLPASTTEMHPHHKTKRAIHQNIKTAANIFLAQEALRHVALAVQGGNTAIHYKAIVLDAKEGNTSRALHKAIAPYCASLTIEVPNPYTRVKGGKYVKQYNSLLAYVLVHKVPRFSMNTGCFDNCGHLFGNEKEHLHPLYDITIAFVRQLWSKTLPSTLTLTCCTRAQNSNKMRTLLAQLGNNITDDERAKLPKPNASISDFVAYFIKHLAKHNGYKVECTRPAELYGPAMFTISYTIQWCG